MNLPTDAGKTLLPRARAALAQFFGDPRPRPDAAWLDEPGACFVTLTQNGKLRGCIGSLEAYRSLRDDLDANAVSAAVRDPRFPALTLPELGHTQIEVSVLSPPEPMTAETEEQACAALSPGTDGVILRDGRHRATFLPQVWQHYSRPADFLAALKRKAGLPAGHWSRHTQLWRYHVQAWAE